MVPKPYYEILGKALRFRAVLFRMVPKLAMMAKMATSSFRAVLFRMVPKLCSNLACACTSFRAVLFRMVPKHYLLS